MHVYDRLLKPYREIVDRLVVETGEEGWEVRRAYLTSVYHALDRGHDSFPDTIHAEDVLAGIIAGMVERLGEPAIQGRLQAGIYAASANREHRTASTEWFDRHPEEYEMIQREIAEGPRLN